MRLQMSQSETHSLLTRNQTNLCIFFVKQQILVIHDILPMRDHSVDMTFQRIKLRLIRWGWYELVSIKFE